MWRPFQSKIVPSVRKAALLLLGMCLPAANLMARDQCAQLLTNMVAASENQLCSPYPASTPHDVDRLQALRWGQGGPWAGQQPYAPRTKPRGWLDTEPSRWPWTGKRDPYDDVDRNALPAATSTIDVQERCSQELIVVTAASSDERRVACSAAGDALRLLGSCRISPQRPLHIQILNEVRHPLSGPVFGLFHIKQQVVQVTRHANIAFLIKGTPYSELPQHEFYKSLIVHEVVHGVMHQNLRRSVTTHAAYEYPAYALQIESLPAGVRDGFLRAFDQRALATDSIFNDSILLFDPFFFAARAYRHFKSSTDGCAHIRALLEGDVDFIAAPP